MARHRMCSSTGPWSAVLPPTNTTDLGPVNGQIRNHLINNIIVLPFQYFRLSLGGQHCLSILPESQQINQFTV